MNYSIPAVFITPRAARTARRLLYAPSRPIRSADMKAGDAACLNRKKGPNMLPMHTASMPGPGGRVASVLTDEVKAVILQWMTRRESPWRVASYLQAYHRIEIDADQILAFWNAHNAAATRTGPGQEKQILHIRTDAAATQTEHRPDKESVQFPEDEAGEPLFTVMSCAEAPDAAPAVTVTPDATADAAPPTRTGPGQEEDSAAAPADAALPDDAREYIIAGMARREPVCMIAETVEGKFGLVMDRDEIIACWRDRDAPPTQSSPTQSSPTRTGPGQKQESRPKLSDEVKAFIVQRFACYETPSLIAAAVRINFGIEIDRRRVFDYNPAGSRPPAQRWIDLHAATRAKFLRDVGEIGIAQKVVRLRMLDRFAQMAEDDHHYDRAARYLQQAARECGGFYEKHRPMPAAQSAG